MCSVVPVPLRFVNEDIDTIVYPAVIDCGSELILADCGYRGQWPALESEMGRIGLDAAKITKAVITHHDHDHMGALGELLDRYPSVTVLCSAAQLPYVNGTKKSLRLDQLDNMDGVFMESVFSKTSEDEIARIRETIASVRPAPGAMPVSPGDVISGACGVEIVNTEGHMPGHISVYVRTEKTLIAGDALVVTDGLLCAPMARFSVDMDAALASIENLLNYDIEKVICYHGGVYSGGVRPAIKALLDRKRS